jgi:hypothetical protein
VPRQPLRLMRNVHVAPVDERQRLGRPRRQRGSRRQSCVPVVDGLLRADHLGIIAQPGRDAGAAYERQSHAETRGYLLASHRRSFGGARMQPNGRRFSLLASRAGLRALAPVTLLGWRARSPEPRATAETEVYGPSLGSHRVLGLPAGPFAPTHKSFRASACRLDSSAGSG